MNNAVLNELGESKSQQMYFKCPSDDGLSDLGLPADAAYPMPPSGPLYAPENQSDTTPMPGGGSFDPFALQKLVGDQSSGGYTYPGLGPNAGPQMPIDQTTRMTPWGPITPVTPFNQYALQQLVTPAAASSGWQNTLLKTLDATIKAGAPAATAYINYTAAQNAMRNQPIQVPGQPGGYFTRSNYTPLIIGGLVIAGVLVALTVFSAKR